MLIYHHKSCGVACTNVGEAPRFIEGLGYHGCFWEFGKDFCDYQHCKKKSILPPRVELRRKSPLAIIFFFFKKEVKPELVFFSESILEVELLFHRTGEMERHSFCG